MMGHQPGGDNDDAGHPSQGPLSHSDAALLHGGVEAFLPQSQSAVGRDDDPRGSASSSQVNDMN